LAAWSDAAGWEALLNRRGTTFRALSEADKADIDRAKALRLMQAHPSMIKRPAVEHPGGLLVGFDSAEWEAALS
jgi:arsenate reductase-like glutaredoxin family protein